MSGRLKKLGGTGESIAEKFLVTNGYQILDTNFRTPFGELDIVALDTDGTVSFVEVKTRKTSSFGCPLAAITYQKKSHIIKSALFYLNFKNYEFSSYRFDAVSIKLGLDKNIELIKNAFETNSDFGF